MPAPYLLDNDCIAPFPDADKALTEPDGLLAMGGDLSPQRLITAYTNGIFPWYSEGQPILWWSPDPRAVLFPDKLKISRSLDKVIRNTSYEIKFDTAFRQVITACAAPRKNGDGTWITPDMINAYCQLHESGIAHSIETWQDGQLTGGLYGLAIGKVFFGESMFSIERDASKLAFVYLARRLAHNAYELIDCQLHSTHLATLGAEDISRNNFIKLLSQYCIPPYTFSKWQSGSDS